MITGKVKKNKKAALVRERTARYRAKLKSRGLMPLSLFAFEPDFGDIRAYADALIQARIENMKKDMF